MTVTLHWWSIPLALSIWFVIWSLYCAYLFKFGRFKYYADFDRMKRDRELKSSKARNTRNSR